MKSGPLGGGFETVRARRLLEVLRAPLVRAVEDHLIGDTQRVSVVSSHRRWPPWRRTRCPVHGVGGKRCGAGLRGLGRGALASMGRDVRAGKRRTMFFDYG